jgi:hypothetical protein
MGKPDPTFAAHIETQVRAQYRKLTQKEQGILYSALSVYCANPLSDNRTRDALIDLVRGGALRALKKVDRAR